MVDINIRLFIPEILIVATAVIILLIDLFTEKKKATVLTVISLTGVLAAAATVIFLKAFTGQTLANNILADPFSIFFKFILLISTAGIITISYDYFKTKDFPPGEYLVLLLFALVGMMVMVSSTDLLVLFIGLETASVSSYVLAGYHKRSYRSSEASLKYLILGTIASAITLYGISFIYGMTGETQMTAIAAGLAGSKSTIAVLGMVLLLIGISFKFAAAPFHQWVPDVYEGAPTPVTAFLATGPKVAAIAVLLRIILIGFPEFIEYWRSFFIILAIMSMFVGNLMAISQKNIKRMLAYSSIAHVGYILIGVIIASKMALTGIFFYATAYMLVNIGAFAIIIAVSQGKGLEQIEDYTGLSRRSPSLALNMALFMVALIGLPPTSGLWGKVYLFTAAIEQGFIWLAIIGLINSAISIYYYANVIRHMYLLDNDNSSSITAALNLRVVATTAALGVLILFFLPQKLLEFSNFSSWFGGLIK